MHLNRWLPCSAEILALKSEDTALFFPVLSPLFSLSLKKNFLILTWGYVCVYIYVVHICTAYIYTHTYPQVRIKKKCEAAFTRECGESPTDFQRWLPPDQPICYKALGPCHHEVMAWGHITEGGQKDMCRTKVNPRGVPHSSMPSFNFSGK